MKSIITSIVEMLFNKIPFSRKAENAKFDIEKSLNSVYEQSIDENEDSLKSLKVILEQSHDVYDVGNLAGYTKEEIDNIKSTDDIKDKKYIQKMIKTYKRFILLESFFSVYIISLIINSVNNLIMNSICIVCFIGLVYVLRKKRKQYQNNYQLYDIKCDNEGKDYIQSLYDKYVKKQINMIILCFVFFSYIIFTYFFAYLTAAYTIWDIYQQLSYSSTLIVLFFFLLLKNIRMHRLLSVFFVEEKEKSFQRHIKKVVIFCGVYWLIIVTVLLLLRNMPEYIFNLLILAIVAGLILLLVHNLTIRKSFVFHNIAVNMRRIIIITVSVISLITYQLMSMDLWLTQPYINTVSAIQREADEIAYDKESGVYTMTTDKQDFKIMQLTDIHLGGSVFSLSKDLRALKAIEKLIKVANPDFVVVTGDLVFPMGVMSFSLNNRAPIMQFASFMRNIGIPWAFTYGNHDTEAMSVITDSQFDELMKSLSYHNSKNLLYPYIQPHIYGRNNQMIEVRHSDGTLMQALFLLDSNNYVPGGQLNEYDYIHDDQVEWYEKQVKQLSQREGYTIPSMLFFHIPLQEYKEAYELYENKSDEVKYYYGEIGETMIDKICTSQYLSQLFDTAIKLGSTKAMFCGHDHYNNLSVEYKGIRLTYGYSIDYLVMPGIDEDTNQRGATLITIDKEGAFDIQPYQLIDIES